MILNGQQTFGETLRVNHNTTNTDTQILSVLAGSLVDGTKIFFSVGKAWATGTAGYVGYVGNATASNNRLNIGFHSKDNILNVYFSGGVTVGSSLTDPGDTNLAVAGKIYVGGNSVFHGAGSGSPEGVVTAPVGSTWSRTNGGAGTSFYVKESGTGNTGWVGK
jgi:hypothetical protein